MRIKALAALAALSLIGGQAAATAAAPLSIAPASRAGAEMDGKGQLVGTTAWILGAIALGLIIWGIIELTSDDDEPDSP